MLFPEMRTEMAILFKKIQLVCLSCNTFTTAVVEWNRL